MNRVWLGGATKNRYIRTAVGSHHGPPYCESNLVRLDVEEPLYYSLSCTIEHRAEKKLGSLNLDYF